MIRVKLKAENIPSEKIAKVLDKFGSKFPFEYRIQTESDTVISEFEVSSMSSLNELTRRLKHIKGIEFKYTKIKKVLPVE